jgi:hypothetical protein
MTTRKKRTEPTASTMDAMLQGIFQSPEYQTALKERLVSGKGVTAAEINLARSLGMRVPVGDGDDEARENLRRMDPLTRGLLSDLDRLAMSPNSTRLRVYQSGSEIGVVTDAALLLDSVLMITRGSAAYQTPSRTPATDSDESLLP